MGYAAARTTTLRLIPNIVVLPYRNPFVVAKAGATLDLLSDGRFTLGRRRRLPEEGVRRAGSRLRRTGALFEEALEVIRGIWTTDDFSFEGRHFTARGITAHPRPVSEPHPPIWIGGNTAAARQRVAELRRRLVPVPGAGGAGADGPHRGAGLGREPRRGHRRSAAPIRRRGPGPGRPSTSRSPISAAAAPAPTTSTPTPICPAWKSLRRWASPGCRSGAGRQPGSMRWRRSSASAGRSSPPRDGQAYAVTRPTSATSPSAPTACASATPLRLPTRKAVAT